MTPDEIMARAGLTKEEATEFWQLALSYPSASKMFDFLATILKEEVSK